MFIDFLAVSLSLIKYYFVSTENHFARGSFVWATVCHHQHQETWSTRPGRLVLGSITGRAPPAPAWVLHRMSSDLIIMDIWSSHSLSLSETANHKTILTLPHSKLLPSALSLNIINYYCEYGNLVRHLVRQVSKKRNKTKLVIVELVVLNLLTRLGWTPSSKYFKRKENLMFLQTLVGDLTWLVQLQ